MNKDLQSILNLIQQSEHLSDEEKKALLKSAKSVDKELEVASFKLDRTEKVKRTTAILLEETIEELENKRKAVEAQNHELEIESCLERVRTIAMSMNKPDDMLNVCRIISEQLELLKVKEIRNVQTAIFYQQKGTYMNYEYYAKHDKTFITETNYTGHEIHQDFANKMLKGNGEFMVAHIKGDEVKAWLKYQKTTNVFIDDYLNTASSLNYYWFSLGPVALGISTYDPLSEEETNLFKRFLKVFELSYRRYLDIEKAEAQAHEAKVEASLEKVRAVAMSMNKPDDLLNICETLYKEFTAFGFADLRNAMINIHNDEAKTFVNYDYSDEIGKSTNHLAYDIHPVIEKQIAQVRSANDAFSETVFAGEDLDDWKKFRKEIGEKDDPRINKAAALHYYFYSIGTGSIGISTFTPVSEEKLKLLKRFRNVFNLSYQRYTDLALAEAQAREAQIELALERVRARTMAMQKSAELTETSFVLFQQFKDLGETSEQISIGIFNEDEHVMELYSTLYGSQWEDSVKVDLDEPVVMKKIHKAWKEQKKSLVIDLSGKRLREYNAYRKKLSNLEYREDRWVIHVAFFSKGAFTFSTTDPHAETIQLLERFASVFEQTYTRFLDLQKAEAQARESQIQLALERVRARTMAMQRSDELGDASHLLERQVAALGIKTWGCAFHIFRENDSLEYHSNANGVNPTFVIPRTYIWQRYYEACQRGETLIIEERVGEACTELYEYMAAMPIVGESLQKMKAAGIPFPTYQVEHAASFKYGYLLFITFEQVPEAHDIFIRFAKVFEQTYTRFLDLQKSEAQARESQIQLALERVRARTMAMQKSNELQEVVNSVYERLNELEVGMDGAAICTFIEGTKDYNVWIGDYSEPLRIKFNEFTQVQRDYNDAIERRKELFTNTYFGEIKKEYIKFLLEQTVLGINIPEEQKKVLLASAFFTTSLACTKNTVFQLYRYTEKSFSKAENDVLKRFANVFEQSYTRFLDLQKAEAQARESQIEASLERVRSRSMAMQKSGELKEVIQVVYDQFGHLNIQVEHTGFIMDYKERDDMHIWLADAHAVPSEISIPYFDSPHWNSFIEAKEKGIDFFANLLNFEEKNKFYQDLFKLVPGVPEETLEYYFNCPGLAGSTVLLENIGLYIENFSGTPYTNDENAVLMRFGKVFQQTYTRFLDLQKAEAQARESQIEAALEKIRSRSLAMHKSDELQEVVNTVFERLKELKIEMDSASIAIFNEGNKDFEFWIASPYQNRIESFRIEESDIPLVKDLFNARKNGLDFWSKSYSFEEKNELFNYSFKNTDLISYSDERKRFLLDSKALGLSFALSKNTGIQINNYSGKLLSEGEIDILKRFAKVFEQTYTRFLDLKKAEAQAREARIEAALERVRSRTMAMHRSEEIADIVGKIFGELSLLDLVLNRVLIWIFNDEEKHISWWSANPEAESNAESYRIDYNDQPVFLSYLQAWQKRKALYLYTLSGDIKKNWDDHLFTMTGLSKLPVAVKKGMREEGTIFTTSTISDYGLMMVGSFEPLSVDNTDIIQRFGRVFQQSYTRYLDVQKAEAQAREAIKRASVDRVRAEIASMRTTNDLERITPLIWNELTTLGVPFIRCGVFIMDEEQQKVQTFLYTEGKTITSFTSTFSNSKLITEALPYWRRKEIYKTHWDEAAFLEQAKSLVEQGSITTGEKYLTEHRPTNLYLHFLPFLQGMLYVGDAASLSEEHLQLVQALAEAFSTAYARYEDFNKLEAAKQQVDKTLVDLKQTQAQLVQSEKMASLGELTAGIAHEIQNPLNFVNNFSEVNKELLAELTEEIEKGNYEEAKMIANDVIGNEEKINHHGKRADGIVKGMLQHSRSSTGAKEPTDINVLADEYVRLAYHGLRAKDKSFNATIKTAYDETIGKINIIPQDIGRAVLNLITNAFYAVNERRKAEGSGYEPAVTVSTKKSDNQVSISVSDNGNGISQKAIDKIFQPFFTTKPTGQGTGLGLSLSYDIVKAHGGEIKVETKEGEGSEFIIQLPNV